jgi:hypothetical protein
MPYNRCSSTAKSSSATTKPKSVHPYLLKKNTIFVQTPCGTSSSDHHLHGGISLSIRLTAGTQNVIMYSSCSHFHAVGTFSIIRERQCALSLFMIQVFILFFFFFFHFGRVAICCARLLACLVAEINSSLRRLFPQFEPFGHMVLRRIIDMGMAFLPKLSDCGFLLLNGGRGWTGRPTYDM